MRLPSEQLYAALMRDIKQCRDKSLPLLISIELCFRLSEQYNRLLQDQLELYTFIDKEEEVCFFKNLQPLFLAESAYYCLLNYAHNFCPPDIDDQIVFWTRQMGRLEKFQRKHPEFYSYYSNGQCQLDAIYYTRPLPGGYPQLIGDLLARKRYHCYAKEQLKNAGKLLP